MYKYFVKLYLICFVDVVKIVFTKCLTNDGTQVTYNFDLIDNESQPQKTNPVLLVLRNAPWWLKDFTAVATNEEKQDDPPSHPLTLMVHI